MLNNVASVSSNASLITAVYRISRKEIRFSHLEKWRLEVQVYNVGRN